MKIVIVCVILGLMAMLTHSNLHLNVKYRDFLNGEGVYSDLLAKQIYAQFKSSKSQKTDYRFKIFSNKLIKIRNHNMGNHSWKQGITKFTDLTFQEFKAQKLMAPQNCAATNKFTVDKLKAKTAPENYDWLNYGVVTPVKDQGDCGSCWTFSTVGAMQSHWNILGKGRNITFSEQQLVDCAGDYDNYGCEGGLPSHAFQYIRHAAGLQTDRTYPYTAKDGQCAYRPGVAVGYVRHGSYNITQGDQEQVSDRLYNAGPISVAFQVIDDFEDYISGIYTTNQCGTTTDDVNHAVLATGYGVSNGIKYWNVKNSWSTEWGQKGYFRIVRGKNMCAIAQCNSYPLIDRAQDIIQRSV